MLNDNNLISIFVKRVPSMFSKKTIDSLVMNNQISFDCARESMAALDVIDTEKIEGIDTNLVDEDLTDLARKNDATQEKMEKLGFYSKVKFEAMLESAKEDERMLYEQFVTLDNARNKVISEIAAKKQDSINCLLTAIKTLPGVKTDEVDGMLKTAVRVEDID